MTSFLIGFYVCGSLFTFVITMPLVILGGKNADVFKPFFWALICPIEIVRFMWYLVRH